MANKIFLGSLLLIFLATGVVYVQFLNDFKIGFSESAYNNSATLSAYYTKNLANRWTVEAKEYGRLFDGTSKMNRNKSSIHYDYFVDEEHKIFVQKMTVSYLRGPKEVHTWYFDGKIHNIEMVPVYHDIEIFGAEGKLYRYEVRDLKDVEVSEDIVSPVQYGKMKLSFQDGYNWAKAYKTGIIKVQYRVLSDYFKIRIRLFDPVVRSVSDVKVESMCLLWINETTQNATPVYKDGITYKNGTVESIFVNYSIAYSTTTVCKDSEPIINFDSQLAVVSELNMGYSEFENKIVLDDKFDGNGDGVCKTGESCCNLEKEIVCLGHNAVGMKERFEKELR